MEQQHLMIDGLKADVYSDIRFSFLSTGAGATKTVDYPVTIAQREELLARAKAEGWVKLHLVRQRYVAFDLRHMMRRRSGVLANTTTYRLVDGQWIESKTTKRDFA